MYLKIQTFYPILNFETEFLNSAIIVLFLGYHDTEVCQVSRRSVLNCARDKGYNGWTDRQEQENKMGP